MSQTNPLLNPNKSTDCEGVPPALSNALAGGNNDHLESVSGLMLIEMPCDIPAENLAKGAMIMIAKGKPIPDGAFGLVRIHSEEQLALGHVFSLDPAHVRIGSAPGYIYAVSDIESIGPMVCGGGEYEYVPVAQLEAELNGELPAADSDDEWPDVIGGAQ